MTRKTRIVLTLAACFAVGCDADGDGTADADDCAPANADIHADAAEVCDGIDNNCDGTIDEGVLTTWYADADQDGWGGTDLVVESCEAPAGFVDDSSDCNDASAAAYPEAPEICDDIDNNCDGLVDDADPTVDLTTGGTYYADADADGYGAPDASVESCGTPTGHVDNADDCNDADAAINPDQVWYSDLDGDGFGSDQYVTTSCETLEGYSLDATDCDDRAAEVNPAADEYCDGIDNNCDGTIDENTALDALTWFEDIDGDGYGSTVTSVECYLPSGYVDVEGDCDDNEAASNPDANEICGDSIDNDCDGVTDYATSIPTDHATIQEAINSASEGDGFCIEAGTYYENLYFNGVSVTLAGYGAGDTVLDGSGSQLLYVYGGEEVTLRGVSIQNAYGNYGGVFDIEYSSFTLQDSELSDVGCGETSYCYGGVLYSYDADVTFEGVEIDGVYGYTTSSLYGAVFRFDNSDVSMTDVTVTDVVSESSLYDSMYAGFLYNYNSDVTLDNVEFSDSWFDSGYSIYGAAVYNYDGSIEAEGLSIVDNTFEASNYQYSDISYGLWYAGGGANTTLSNSLIQGNELWAADDVGGLLYLSSAGSMDISNTLITDNTIGTTQGASGNQGYGLFYIYNSDVTLTNSDVTNNTWDGFDYLYGVLGYRSYLGNLTVLNSNVVGNVDTEGVAYAGLLYSPYANTDGYGEFSWSYSNHYDNWDTWSYGYDWYDGGSDGDFTSFEGVITDDPLYTDAANGDYTLATGSPAIDAGTTELLDTDGTTSDIGAYGGPDASL